MSLSLLLLAAPLSAALHLSPVPASTVASRAASVSMIDKNKKIPTKNVWVSIVPASEAKPNTITSGFQYGIEVAVVCDSKGTLYGFSNKMPPTGQPTTFATVADGCVVEPVTATKYNLKTGKLVGTWCPNPIGRLLIGRVTQPQDLQTYPVRKQGGNVQALINVNAKAQFEQSYWRGILDSQGKVDGGYY